MPHILPPFFPFLSICCCLLCRCRPFRAQFSRVFIGSPFPSFSGKIVLLPSFELALLGVRWKAVHLTTAADDCRLLAGAATRKPHGSSIGKQFSPSPLPTSSFSFVFIFFFTVHFRQVYIGAIGTIVQEKATVQCAHSSVRSSLPRPLCQLRHPPDLLRPSQQLGEYDGQEQLTVFLPRASARAAPAFAVRDGGGGGAVVLAS